MLSVKDLTIEYPGGLRALDGVSFTLPQGENAALIGANGAGKSSLLLSLVGVLPPASGEIAIDGTLLTKKTLRETRKRLQLVFQNPDDQLFMPTIFEDVAFGPRSFGMSEEETLTRVQESLSRLGIAHLKNRSPIALSGGEKRLCAIATVLSLTPEFLLFDEPTAFLDPKARRSLAETLLQLPQGKLIATHDLPFARQTCSRVLLLREGKLLYDGGAEVLEDAALLEEAGL
ncbi:MAG: energy-coupling factor ABC transporter ATP-binding protein [Oscillospiraceae bacterium]|nr:energy-coupling factor ABC transporter ATP-binding protein [Oscillospiraceae bacterium]